MIYFDNSATTIKKPPQVAKAVYDAIASGTFGNPSRGIYEASHHGLKSLYECRRRLAEFFSVEDPLKIAFTPNVTTSLNLVLKGLFTRGDHIITGVLEHNSVLRPLYQLEEEGVELSFLKLDEKFGYDLTMLDSLLRKNTVALVLTQLSNVTGAVTNLDKLYDFCKNHGLLLILDGAQGAGSIVTEFKGQLPELIYCFTGHKSLYGPMGTGGIVNLSRREFKNVMTGGAGVRSFDRHNPQEFPDVFEAGTVNIHSLMGLKAGVEELLDREMVNVEKYLKFHRNKLYQGLKNIPGVQLYSPEEGGPIVSFNIEGKNAQEIVQELYYNYKICSRGGAHCAPEVHRQMKTEERGMVRLSLSMYNRVEEIDHALFAIQKLARG